MPRTWFKGEYQLDLSPAAGLSRAVPWHPKVGRLGEIGLDTRRKNDKLLAPFGLGVRSSRGVGARPGGPTSLTTEKSVPLAKTNAKRESGLQPTALLVLFAWCDVSQNGSSWLRAE